MATGLHYCPVVGRILSMEPAHIMETTVNISQQFLQMVSVKIKAGSGWQQKNKKKENTEYRMIQLSSRTASRASLSCDPSVFCELASSEHSMISITIEHFCINFTSFSV